jgi:cytidylate kinase
MNIITISREFGSGGREVGKRLADALGYGYYDREILTAMAQSTEMKESYLEQILEQGAATPQYPLIFGRTLSQVSYFSNLSTTLLAKQTELIKKIAQKGNCVIVGRNANVILAEQNPLRIFVYAELESRIQRCRERETENMNRTDNEYEKQIKEVDKLRAKNHDFLCPYRWGDMRGYDLCLNTSYLEIKKIIPSVAQYATQWFGK